MCWGLSRLLSKLLWMCPCAWQCGCLFLTDNSPAACWSAGGPAAVCERSAAQDGGRSGARQPGHHLQALPGAVLLRPLPCCSCGSSTPAQIQLFESRLVTFIWSLCIGRLKNACCIQRTPTHSGLTVQCEDMAGEELRFPGVSGRRGGVQLHVFRRHRLPGRIPQGVHAPCVHGCHV